MAHTLTVPFQPTIAERQYDELESKTRFRIRITGQNQSEKASEQTLLPHLVSGKIDKDITEAAKEMLYNEITRNIDDTGRLMQKQLKREKIPDAPVYIRDVLVSACDRWVHLLGEILETIHAGDDTIAAERQRLVLEIGMVSEGLMSRFAAVGKQGQKPA